MYMYNPEGQKALVMAEQVDALLAAGWTKNPPEVVETQEGSAPATEPAAETEASEEESNDAGGEAEAGPAATGKPKIVFKKK